jgi:lysophospholipase L1-like esterase
MAKSCSVGPEGRTPEIILVAPPPVAELTALAEMFDGAQGKSRGLGALYRSVAATYDVGFINAGEHISCSLLDGIHYEVDQHNKLGRVMAAAVKERLR